MKRKVSKLRLSPNEEAQLIREEQERRRKLRIQQVREQQRYIAQQIRQNVERKRQRELQLLGEQLREDWERQQREKLLALQNLYQESLRLVGQGHRSAKENEPDLEAIAQREEENQAKAEERYREALRELHTQRLRDNEKQRKSTGARNKALQAEKERAARVSSLPPPPPNPLQSVVSKGPPVRRRYDVGMYANTYFHMSATQVDREEDSDQPNAQEGAEQEMRRLEDLQMEEERKREEQIEKARLRGQQALKKEKHVQDRERLLVELEHLQQTDLLRRRQQLSLMPSHIIQPLYKRQEMKEDFQRELVFAFEDVYSEERRVNDDTVLQLLPEPLPPPSPGRQDQELDVTQDDVSTVDEVNVQPEAPRDEPETTSQVDLSRPAHRQTLRKLLDRIRNQTNQTTPCASQSSLIPVDELPADQIPEKDTSIETGSLSNEERAGPPLIQPTHPPAVLEGDEDSSLADQRIPESVSDGERRMRELELEKEKQQQVLLLQELEEQKTKLEQLLLHAQQERDALKTAMTQEAPADRPEPVAEDQTGTQQPEVHPSPSEDDHPRRVREYQERLLEQNRAHQRSVEVARQRLKDYQRALQIRYSMSAAPPAHPQPPLHVASGPGLPKPSQPRAKPTSLHAPTREVAAEAPLGLHSLSPSFGRHHPTATAPAPSTSADVPTRDSPVSALPLHILGSFLPDRLEPSRASIPHRVLATEHLGTISPHQLLEHTTYETQGSVREDVQLGTEEREEEKSLRPKLREAERLLQQTQQELDRQGQELQELRRLRQLEEEAERIVAQRRLEDDAQRQLEERKAQHLREVQGAIRQEEVQGLQEAHGVRGKLQETQRLLHRRLQEMESQGQELQEAQRLLEQRRLEEMEAQREIRRRQLEMERQEQEVQETRRVVEQGEEEEELRQKLQKAQRLSQERQQVRELQVVLRLMEQRRLEEMEAQREIRWRQLEMERQEQEVQETRRVVEQGEEEEELRQKLQKAQRLSHERQQERELQVRRLMGQRPLEETEAQRQQEERVTQQRIRAEEDQRQQKSEEFQGRAPSDEWTQDEEAQMVMEQRRGHQEEVTQLAPEVPDDGPASERIRQARLKVLVSLLKAIEESRGGSLSHLEDEEDEQPEQPSASEPPPRVAKPPVTRVRLDKMEQHELSAIQEVDSPVDISQVADQEVGERSTSHAALWLEEWSSSLSSDEILQLTTGSSRGQQLLGTLSDELMWRERLLMGVGTSPELSDSDSAKRTRSTPSSDSGRGADYSAPAGTTCRLSTEVTGLTDGQHSMSALRPSHSVSSICSPGITVDPAANLQISVSTSQQEDGSRQGTDWVDVSSSFSHSPAARSSVLSVESMFSDNSIQRIIDRYTRELDESLSSAGKHTDAESSTQEDPGPSVSQNSFVALTPRGAEVGDSSSSDQPVISSSDLSDIPIPEHHSPSEEPSVAVDPGQDSFRPLVGQLDLSSSITVDHQESHMEQLVGQPFAQSSMITGNSVLRGWDSTLSRMMGRLSHQTTSQWTSAVQNLQPVSETEPLTSWFSECPEESVMRPLVWELDESSGRSGSSSDRSCVEVSAGTAAPPHPSIPPEAPSLSAAAPCEDPHQDRTVAAEGSFFALLPEVTHNETADPTMTFNPLEQEVSTSSERQPADSSHASQPSPERLRVDRSGVDRPDQDVELTALSLCSSSQCEVTTFLTQPEHDQDRRSVAPTGEPESEQSLELKRKVADARETLQEASGVKGILEQSEITLASLSEDEETTGRLEEVKLEEPSPDVSHGSETLVAVREEQVQDPSVTLLQFHWGPADPPDVYQQKRSALIQRSSRRVEDIRARRDQAKTETSGTPRAESGAPRKTRNASKLRRSDPAGDQTTSVEQELHTTPADVCSDSRLKTAEEVKTCDPERRKRDMVDMRRRTQRLYEQLEEVKTQKAARSRQEENARNRLKAQEFHKKTLVKLRAKLPPPP